MQTSKIFIVFIVISFVLTSCHKVRFDTTETVNFDASTTVQNTGAFNETMSITDDEIRSEFEFELGDTESDDVIGISSIVINAIRLRFDVKSDNEAKAVNVSGSLDVGGSHYALFDEDEFVINRTGLFEYPVDNLKHDAVKKIQDYCIHLYEEDGDPTDLPTMTFNIQGAPSDNSSYMISTDIFVVIVLQTGVTYCQTVPPFIEGEPCNDEGIYWPFPF